MATLRCYQILCHSNAHRNVYRYDVHVEKRAGEVRRYVAHCLEKGRVSGRMVRSEILEKL